MGLGLRRKMTVGVFQNYSRHGDRRGAGTQLTLSQSDKWLRQVGDR